MSAKERQRNRRIAEEEEAAKRGLEGRGTNVGHNEVPPPAPNINAHQVPANLILEQAVKDRWKLDNNLLVTDSFHGYLYPAFSVNNISILRIFVLIEASRLMIFTNIFKIIGGQDIYGKQKFVDTIQDASPEHYVGFDLRMTAEELNAAVKFDDLTRTEQLMLLKGRQDEDLSRMLGYDVVEIGRTFGMHPLHLATVLVASFPKIAAHLMLFMEDATKMSELHAIQANAVYDYPVGNSEGSPDVEFPFCKFTGDDDVHLDLYRFPPQALKFVRNEISSKTRLDRPRPRGNERPEDFVLRMICQTMLVLLQDPSLEEEVMLTVRDYIRANNIQPIVDVRDELTLRSAIIDAKGNINLNYVDPLVLVNFAKVHSFYGANAEELRLLHFFPPLADMIFQDLRYSEELSEMCEYMSDRTLDLDFLQWVNVGITERVKLYSTHGMVCSEGAEDITSRAMGYVADLPSLKMPVTAQATMEVDGQAADGNSTEADTVSDDPPINSADSALNKVLDTVRAVPQQLMDCKALFQLTNLRCEEVKAVFSTDLEVDEVKARFRVLLQTLRIVSISYMRDLETNAALANGLGMAMAALAADEMKKHPSLNIARFVAMVADDHYNLLIDFLSDSMHPKMVAIARYLGAQAAIKNKKNKLDLVTFKTRHTGWHRLG